MCSAGLFSLRTVEVSWGVWSAPGVCRVSLRIIHEPSTLLSSEYEANRVISVSAAGVSVSSPLRDQVQLGHPNKMGNPSSLLTLNTFLVEWRSTLLAADWAGLAAWAWRNRHVVLVSSCQQAVSVGNQRQPHVLPTLWHRLWHELLQVRVAVEAAAFYSIILFLWHKSRWGFVRKAIQHKNCAELNMWSYQLWWSRGT